MNKLILLLALMTSFSRCTPQQAEPELVASCGVNNPTQDLPWLKEILTKAEADKATRAYKGNYLGTIYLGTHKNQSVIMVRMMMGSGGIYAYLFDCDGQRVELSQATVPTLFSDIEKRNQVLYTNLP